MYVLGFLKRCKSEINFVAQAIINFKFSYSNSNTILGKKHMFDNSGNSITGNKYNIICFFLINL